MRHLLVVGLLFLHLHLVPTGRQRTPTHRRHLAAVARLHRRYHDRRLPKRACKAQCNPVLPHHRLRRQTGLVDRTARRTNTRFERHVGHALRPPMALVTLLRLQQHLEVVRCDILLPGCDRLRVVRRDDLRHDDRLPGKRLGEAHRAPALGGVGEARLEHASVLEVVRAGLEDEVGHRLGGCHAVEVVPLVDLHLEAVGRDVAHADGGRVAAVGGERGHHDGVGVGVPQRDRVPLHRRRLLQRQHSRLPDDGIGIPGSGIRVVVRSAVVIGRTLGPRLYHREHVDPVGHVQPVSPVDPFEVDESHRTAQVSRSHRGVIYPQPEGFPFPQPVDSGGYGIVPPHHTRLRLSTRPYEPPDALVRRRVNRYDVSFLDRSAAKRRGCRFRKD